MYLNFYHFKKEPFQITPDPEFLFLSPSHKEALASIIYGIEEKKGFIAILGGVGVGKTTILRAYLEKVDRERVKVIYIFNANLSFESLLNTIYRELGLIQKTSNVFMMVNDLHEYLIDEYKKGFNVVLIIDEAQNMPVETLENLRMLSNLETATDKLVQIVLIGQPEFDNKLNLHELRQLQQRIAIRTVISPLNSGEALRYIEHRLSKVMMTDEPVFTKAALREIVSSSKGIPRVINILCDNAFITGFGYQKKPVTAGIVREICADFRSEKKKKQQRQTEYFLRWKTAAALVLIAVLTVLTWISPYRASLWKQVEEFGMRAQVAKQLPPKKTMTVAMAKPEKRVVKREVKTPETSPTVNQSVRLPANRTPAQKVVEKGDTLSKILVARYGFFDGNLLNKMREINPSIKDVDKIYIGDRISFPAE